MNQLCLSKFVGLSMLSILLTFSMKEVFAADDFQQACKYKLHDYLISIEHDPVKVGYGHLLDFKIDSVNSGTGQDETYCEFGFRAVYDRDPKPFLFRGFISMRGKPGAKNPSDFSLRQDVKLERVYGSEDFVKLAKDVAYLNDVKLKHRPEFESAPKEPADYSRQMTKDASQALDQARALLEDQKSDFRYSCRVGHTDAKTNYTTWEPNPIEGLVFGNAITTSAGRSYGLQESEDRTAMIMGVDLKKDKSPAIVAIGSDRVVGLVDNATGVSIRCTRN